MPARGAAQQQPPTFRSGVDVVSFGVTVVDKKGNYLTDLAPGRLRGLRGRPEADAQVLHSLRGAGRRRRRRGAAPPGRAVRHQRQHGGGHRLRAQRRDQVPQQPERGARLHAGRLRHRGARRALQPGGVRAAGRADPKPQGGRLHGALRRARRLPRRRVRQDGRKILVLYTDGGDNASSITFGDLLDLLKASDVTVYAIGFLEHQSALGRRWTSGCGCSGSPS